MWPLSVHESILSPSSGSTPGYEGEGESDKNISRKPGNVLKTLDPILITIIAMSALGVLLGAVCGVVLYCACWHNGMSERNLSALENYNFELVDGVKLKKDKLNPQSNYSEAWRRGAGGSTKDRGGRTVEARGLCCSALTVSWKGRPWRHARLFSGASMSVTYRRKQVTGNNRNHVQLAFFSWFRLDNQKPVETQVWLTSWFILSSPFSSLSLPCDGFFSETAKSKMLAPGIVQWALLMDMWSVAQCPEHISVTTFQGTPTSTFASLTRSEHRGGEKN